MGTLKKDLTGNLRIKYKVVELSSSLPLTWATLSPSEEWRLQCLFYEAISVCVQSPLKMDVGANDLPVLCVLFTNTSGKKKNHIFHLLDTQR